MAEKNEASEYLDRMLGNKIKRFHSGPGQITFIYSPEAAAAPEGHATPLFAQLQYKHDMIGFFFDKWQTQELIKWLNEQAEPQ